MLLRWRQLPSDTLVRSDYQSMRLMKTFTFDGKDLRTLLFSVIASYKKINISYIVLK